MSQIEVIENADGSVRFEFRWGEPSDRSSVQDPSYGELVVRIQDKVVWGKLDEASVAGIHGCWIELLEYLSNHWVQLVAGLGYPFGLQPLRPSEFAKEYERRRESVAEADEDADEELAFAFKLSRNLAESSPGTVRPDLWIVREGGYFVVEAGTDDGPLLRLPATDVKRLLVDLGNAVSHRLSAATDARSADAVRNWTERESDKSFNMATLVTGMQSEYVADVCDGESPAIVFDDPDCNWIDDNVFIDLMYRCKGAVAPHVLRQIFGKVRAFDRKISENLATLSSEASQHLSRIRSTKYLKPFEEGHLVADWLRSTLRSAEGKFDPEQFSNALGIPTETLDFGSRHLDAVAFWAHGKQPAILLNASEKHRKNEGAKRATLCHEICHLLIDREFALPLSAVVRGSMERRVEQRANAFAAQLLCPKQAAGAAYLACREVAIAVAELTVAFGVSRELAANQLAASSTVRNWKERQVLEHIGLPKFGYPWETYES